MSLVDQNATLFVNLIVVGSSRASAHENDRSTSKSKIHASLYAGSNRRAHLRV
jgi:hypothetical protein